MSTMTKPNHHVPSSDTATKKKFGKNLNKLTKPPPPTSVGAKPNNNSRNGLLLLSTKRNSSAQSNVSAGGILANKPSAPTTTKPLPSLGLHNQSTTSTHDALLGAVVGASRAETQQPDAWGVAEKSKTPTKDLEGGNDVERSGKEPHEEEPTARKLDFNTGTDHDFESSKPDNNDFVRSNWDEYGGRDHSKSSKLYSPEDSSNVDEQKMVMSKMAKDRAEKRRAEEEARQAEQRQRATQRLHDLEVKIGAVDEPDRGNGGLNRVLLDPNNFSEPQSQQSMDETSGRVFSGPHSPDPKPDEKDPFSRKPVIQLASYDDRDRGERGSTGGPRMLFDPKSGSMVAVPSRDDATSANKGRKERGKKGKGREKDSKFDQKNDSDAPRNGKKNKRDKKAAIEAASLTKGDSRKGKLSSDRKFPRTCGVLYARDKRGNFSCRDGCDGDLGYGAHSVPGGRVKNSFAYSKYLEVQKQARQEDNSGCMNELNTPYDNSQFYGDTGGEVELHTGFNIPSPAQVKYDWVKSSDKIELVTGIDDSPTLQATAKAWAPSQAAIAATSRVDSGASQENRKTGKPTESAHREDSDDDDDTFGLGFDPTLNMNSMMQSPSVEAHSGLETVDLTSLSLEPAFQGTGSTKTNDIFAFGTGSTWGTSSASGSNDNWGLPSSGGNATSFLALSTGSAWSGVPSLGSSSITNTSLNGEHGRSAGD